MVVVAVSCRRRRSFGVRMAKREKDRMKSSISLSLSLVGSFPSSKKRVNKQSFVGEQTNKQESKQTSSNLSDSNDLLPLIGEQAKQQN